MCAFLLLAYNMLLSLGEALASGLSCLGRGSSSAIHSCSRGYHSGIRRQFIEIEGGNELHRLRNDKAILLLRLWLSLAWCWSMTTANRFMIGRFLGRGKVFGRDGR